ncbi:hypothetical protein [Ferruginibacter albus]|uniref:hypothetical protein n=1 Tax=Ferruginibacter albus TaxID=2875540 RepID=UPI001CC82F81|nr:hypothetical protein [Ferruginibacter albus]UAY50788.1 hypothetical protein K9M53_09310 [Ferruginibacter albus]
MKLELLVFYSCVLLGCFNICNGQVNALKDTDGFILDTLINNANINDHVYSIEIFRNPNNDDDDSNDNSSLQNDSTGLIFIVKNNKTGKLIYSERFKENDYHIFKISSDSISEKGRLFLEVEFNGGGSGFAGKCYEVTAAQNNIAMHLLYSVDELSLFYFISDDEIIKLEGIWNFKEDESHFANHRYLVTKYMYVNNAFVESKLGRTKYKYASLDELESPKKVLLSIRKREPQILKGVNIE